MEQRRGVDLAGPFARREVIPAAAQPRDPGALAEQALGGDAADAYQDPRPHQGDVPVDEGPAQGDLLARRVPVSGRPPEQDIADAGAAAVASDGREHAVEQSPGGADEGQAAAVFLRPGRLADQHQVGARIAVREHRRLRRALEGASVERGDRFGEGGDVEALCRDRARLLYQGAGRRDVDRGRRPRRLRGRSARGRPLGLGLRRDTPPRGLVHRFVGAHLDKPAQRRDARRRRAPRHPIWR